MNDLVHKLRRLSELRLQEEKLEWSAETDLLIEAADRIEELERQLADMTKAVEGARTLTSQLAAQQPAQSAQHAPPAWWIDFGTYGQITQRKEEADAAIAKGLPVVRYTTFVEQPAQSEDARMLDWLEMMGNKPEGLLLHDGGDFTGRTGLGLRRIGRSLRQACRQAMQAGEKNALTRCHASRDGECGHSQCPQLRDGEPMKTGRHCPLDTQEDDA